MPNLAKLAQLELVEVPGDLNLVTIRNKETRNKESERRYIFWLQNAHFQTVIKSKLFRISACGKRERIRTGAKS